MRNLEDKTLHQVVDAVVEKIRSLGLPTPATLNAACKAYMEACRHPDSLVRVTMTEEEEVKVFEYIATMDESRKNIDWVKTSNTNYALDLDDPLFIEFKNGSGIELVMR